MWQPLSQEELLDMIDGAELMMEPLVRAFWNRIKITPEKRQLSPWGDLGGGFWVVALVGRECIYYNDIEDGFNSSPYDKMGRINDYRCSQPDLLSSITAYRQDFVEAISAER